ncbi:photosystem II repair protein PSB27-H1, chloroplastic [Magnolia sinica]|uniref:photosystem II repair protein PSB27-H1, chloroplastic n=1 Tax=Magnolia sinica TaxID=86752 RepID=UPI0026587AE2|nr:photosystem II repair protein PSB27-H1, chloroplastic [Magnolia sinica]
MASPSLLTHTSTSKPIALIRCKSTITGTTPKPTSMARQTGRRELMVGISGGLILPTLLIPVSPSLAASDEEYVKETEEVISKIRSTINMDKTDPKVAMAVAELREASNSWVAKYRREKALLGRASFRDMYSALNAVSGHYISFGPTAPIPAKRKARILEEMDTAEKALLRGR